MDIYRETYKEIAERSAAESLSKFTRDVLDLAGTLGWLLETPEQWLRLARTVSFKCPICKGKTKYMLPICNHCNNKGSMNDYDQLRVRNINYKNEELDRLEATGDRRSRHD